MKQIQRTKDTQTDGRSNQPVKTQKQISDQQTDRPTDTERRTTGKGRERDEKEFK